MELEVTIHEAKTHFSRLVRQVQTGDEVVVKRGRIPVARLVPYGEPVTRPPRAPGAMKGQIWIADDFEELPEDLQHGLGTVD